MAKNNENPEITAKAIIQVLGSPKEHLEKSLKLLSEDLEKKYNVLEKKVSEPKKEGEKFFSSFIDAEMSFQSFSEMMGFVIDFHPSSIEIIEPEEITESSIELTGILNDLIGKIHRMDSQTRALFAKYKMLEKQLKKD
jgi:hypothetical protein